MAHTDSAVLSASISSQFLSVPHGLILRGTYEHGNRHSDILHVTYNERMRQFVILDSKGVTAWKRDAVEPRVQRVFSYSSYEYSVFTTMLYANKYNCYFVLCKDFSLKVYNRDFAETCCISADLRSVLFMLFNPVKDELITCGVGGTKVWQFLQRSGNSDRKFQASHTLTLKYELPKVAGTWVRRVELDQHLQHLYCCSDQDLFVYNLEGRLLMKFEKAHQMPITGCVYSQHSSVLVTSSLDTEVKVWSLAGGLLHTFRGHSRAVTNLLLHPATSSLVITSSLDGTLRLWSLNTMDCLYSLVVSADGIQWMGLTDDHLLYLSTTRTLTLCHLNYNLQFWALARSQVMKIERCSGDNKTTRVMALSEDSSVRLLATASGQCLTTVLPPPTSSPLRPVLSLCYSRELGLVYLLVNSHDLWLYTAKTDPACRTEVWNMIDIQKQLYGGRNLGLRLSTGDKTQRPVSQKTPSTSLYKDGLSQCCCLSLLPSHPEIWAEAGFSRPIKCSFLLVGLEDGRILFLDPIVKGEQFLTLKTGKAPVVETRHDNVLQELLCLHKLGEEIKVTVWGLPNLTCRNVVHPATDLSAFVRLGSVLMTGHTSGSVMFYSLRFDAGLELPSNRASFLRDAVEGSDNDRSNHLAPVIAVDVCVVMNIFCSCSQDGCIKVWLDRTLLTEIMLDSRVSSVCFLNNRGDLLLGYQDHLFYMDHTRGS